MEENKEQSEQPQASPEAPKEQPQETMADVLKAFSGAPAQSKIEEWKVQFGEVFVFGFSEEELYIFRPLFRGEHLELQQIAKTDLEFQELLCDKCVVWKSKPVVWAKAKAGTLHTLQEMILSNSNFMPVQTASLLVAKL